MVASGRPARPTDGEVSEMADEDGPEIGDLLGMGASIAGLLIIGFGIGCLVDQLPGTFPVFALTGLFLGVIAACFYMYGQFKRYM